MKMEIKTISTEIIKPSSPTPNHLRTHVLFLPNLILPDIYVPTIFFYSAQSNNAMISSSHLKKSLAKTLTFYYPFAGQVKDAVSTDCNDHGAIFIETQVANEMSEVLQEKDNDVLKQLLPCNGNIQEIPTTYDTNLVVQVNYFRCGGIAISICLRHRISDASSIVNFVKNWAEVYRGAADIKNTIADYSSIYPPYNANTSMMRLFELQNHYFQGETVTKMFVFEGTKIAALKDKITNRRPTTFEAISALILSALIKIIRATAIERDDELKLTQLAVVIPINLRNKIYPPLPMQCIGNLVSPTIAKLSLDKEVDYNHLVGTLHESVNKVIDEYKMNKHEGGAMEGLSNNLVFSFSDVSKLPYYEADFGWGKPAFAVTLVMSDNVVVLTQTSNGEGVEAWIRLPKEVMVKFEQDPQILAHAQLLRSKRARL